MKTVIKILFVTVVLLPLTVSADVKHYSICELNDGKTLTDAMQWVSDWRTLVKNAGIEYKIQLLTGHAAPAEVMPPNFIIEGTSSTLTSHGAAWDWWPWI